MAEHKCLNAKELQQMRIDIELAKSDIKSVKDDIKDMREDTKEIKTDIKKFNWWLLGLMGTALLTLAGVFLKG